MGFETTTIKHYVFDVSCVNLPRWGLKQGAKAGMISRFLGVNLPRWGLKQAQTLKLFADKFACKFTPLGFETAHQKKADRDSLRVNLPRWGLKHATQYLSKNDIKCKFTPLGFET